MTCCRMMQGFMVVGIDLWRSLDFTRDSLAATGLVAAVTDVCGGICLKASYSTTAASTGFETWPSSVAAKTRCLGCCETCGGRSYSWVEKTSRVQSD